MKKRTQEQQREYMRAFRARKRAEQQQSVLNGPGATATATPQREAQPHVAVKPQPALVDCAACGHDRAYYHLAACTHPYVAGAPQSGIVGSPCGCPHFIDPSEPF